MKRRILALVPEAFGGFGGIARAEEDLLEAIAVDPRVDRVEVHPRLIRQTPPTLPEKVHLAHRAAGGKLSFVRSALAAISRKVDLVLCGHLNLAFLSLVVARACGAKAVLMIHGIEAWDAPPSPLTRIAVRQFDLVISVSRVSSRRFRSWAEVPRERVFILPNRVDLDSFSPGPADPQLIDRYRLDGARVLMTLGRIDPPERYKGFHEVVDALPRIAEEIPEVIYLIAGDGDGRAELERRAGELGVLEHIRFTGRIDEHEKRQLYRSADLFVMPSRGEGFGIVVLEALASGTPVVASRIDGTKEAIMNGRLGILVDPRDREQIISAIVTELDRKRSGGVDPRLSFYGVECHERRVRRFLDRLWPNN